MTPVDSPYARALEGLRLEDPVEAFFAFCREREGIRQRRAAGQPGPWSDDPVFQQGRFLNVFREDDRCTQALMRFLGRPPEEDEQLVQAVFFARWCNRSETLDQLSRGALEDPEALRGQLETLPEPPWCNVTAYPVGPVSWEGERWSRLETATTLLRRIRGELTRLIREADRDVVRATASIQERFRMDNDFPIFMAVMDLAWFRPELIDPASPVPTGIGAAPFLDILQEHLGLADHHQTCQAMIALQPERWPEARRALQPIDVEYLSCECRKYYSYRLGTKEFTGKNRFRAGGTPRLEWDPPGPEADQVRDSEIKVIAGGPGSGKSSLIQALRARGFSVVEESSERLLREGLARGESARSLRLDPLAWQRRILELDWALFDELADRGRVFTDTSFIEDLVFSERAGLFPGPQLEAWLRLLRYDRVFFLEPLEGYAQTAVRLESQRLSRHLSQQIYQRYLDWGYQPLRVPPLPLEQRVDWVLARLEGSTWGPPA